MTPTVVELSADGAAELLRRLGLPGPVETRDRWVGATSTVVQWGDELAVKVPHHDPEAVRACLVHARVSTAVRLLGVEAPEIVAVEDLSPLVPVPVIVSRFLPGRRLSPGDSDPAVWFAVGQRLARLHTASAGDAPAGLRTFRQHQEVDPATMTGRLLAAGRLTSRTTGRLLELRDQLVGHVLPDDHPVLCHGDLHAENVIAAAGRYVGLVDFAGAGWLDAAWDFTATPLEAVTPAVEGYQAAGGSVTSLRERIAWCRLQTAILRLSTADSPEDEALRAAVRVTSLIS